MAKVKHQMRQSQTEKEFCEILKMADPIVSRFVSEHEAFRARNEALLERVTVLEKALEKIAGMSGDEIKRWSSTPHDSAYKMRSIAQAALDG